MKNKLHDFGYGKNCSDIFNDSVINKLEIKKAKDLEYYLKELLESQLINVKANKNTIKKSEFSDIKLIIRKIK